jgi:hypothetical protein
MKKKGEFFLEFEIDKITNSIENAISGEVFQTEITLLSLIDEKQINKKDWGFDWHSELVDNSKRIYKINTVENPNIIQGLVCLTDKGDHIFMDLIEAAKFNKGHKKLYLGVAGNLVAFVCKYSFELGYDGIVSFIAKTQLIEHYQISLGAKLFGRNRMFIDKKESLFLVKKYFKEFEL